MENTDGKSTKLLLFHMNEVASRRGSGRNRSVEKKKCVGGRGEQMCNCRAAVLSGGGCHLESGWLSNGH